MHPTPRAFALASLALALFALAASPLAAGETTAAAVFDRLTALEGTWTGTADVSPEGVEGTSVFRVSANGSVVMETMEPGGPHEMINMYHLDGDDLVVTHYCSAGNQPTMRLDLARASATEAPFVFTGGSNLDAAHDDHIHDLTLRFVAEDEIEAHWTHWEGGEEGGTLVIRLERVGG